MFDFNTKNWSYFVPQALMQCTVKKGGGTYHLQNSYIYYKFDRHEL